MPKSTHPTPGAARLLAAIVALVMALAVFWPSVAAHAVVGEGTITYDSADGTPNLDPSAHEGPGRVVSGSKTATPLDANDQSNITVSLPGAGSNDFDIVLVIDGTKGLPQAGPAVAQMLSDLADDLKTRPDANVNVGIVGYGTVGYTRFARPGEIFALNAYRDFVNNVKKGTLTGHNIGEYQSLLDYLPPLPNFPEGALTAEGTVETYRYLLGDEAGLVHLTSDNVQKLNDKTRVNGANFAIQAMMTHSASVAFPDPAHSLQATHRFIIHNPVVGTNLEAGIKAGQAQLATGSAPAGNKMLIIVSDAGTYFWNDPTDTPSQSLSGGVHEDTNSIAWAQKSGDWHSGNLASSTYDNYADFLANTDVTTSTKSQLSIADYHLFAKNNASYDPSVLTQDVADRTGYPYVSLEKGMAHAAVALQNVVKENPNERVMLLGSEYKPNHGTGPGSAYDMSRKWQQWASKVVDTYVNIKDATQGQLEETLAHCRQQLWLTTTSAQIGDTFGPDFRLVTSKQLASTDVTVTIGGQAVPGVIDPNDA
ncbi:MAG: VWA domain-containing protein, partial [Propionibacteriaceae bacterium]|nr:VWA domain-containing protein [Propionibacteriaceae bacterium]